MAIAKVKKRFIETEKKLKGIISRSVKDNHTEAALQALNALCVMKYHYNQEYVDSFIESSILKIAKEIKEKRQKEALEFQQENTILYYDSFGLDTRGLTCIYLKALVELKLDCKIVYITNNNAIGKQPLISKILDAPNVVIEYIDYRNGYLNTLNQILELFIKHKPKYAFEYNQPWDVAGIIGFSVFNHVMRYKINLTDHAFWSGTSSFDYCIEFRDYGASISKKYRKIEPKRQIMLPYYPYIDSTVEFQGLPFPDDKRFIFTGGSLYKTINKENTYYNMIAHMLSEDSELLFLYAGKGDDSELKKLSERFDGRVFHIPERTDLYQVMKRCLFYVNSYPVIGGLMTQYAAISGKIPLTINHGGRAEGLLFNRDDVITLFSDAKTLLAEADKLLKDDAYLKKKSEKVRDLVITPEQFKTEVQRVLTECKTSFETHFEDVNVTSVRTEYAYSFSVNHIESAIITSDHKKLYQYFPLLLFRKIGRKILKK